MIFMDNLKHPDKSKSVKPETLLNVRWVNKSHKKVKIVEVLWRDAVSVSGDDWAEPEEADAQRPAKTLSVGYLWADEDDYVTLVSLVNDAHIGYGITIPRGMIVEIRDLL